MSYRKGDRVRHPNLDDWGLGEVLENSSAKEVRVFFVGVGEKRLSLEHVKPVKVADSDAAHPVLDNLSVSSISSGIRYQSLEDSIDRFLSAFPQGFHGDKFWGQERCYKEKAHNLAKELLQREDLHELAQRDAHSEIVRRALQLSNATNLIFPNEKMALRDGLASEGAMEQFATTLFDLLHGNSSDEKRFVRFFDVLELIGAAKWPIATYFTFFLQPDRHMFVKPAITQHAAKLCAFEISYESRLNWATYSRVLGLADYLLDELAELKPRDMIDVQSFMWCIADHS